MRVEENKSVNPKVAIATGASSGIGRATAVALAKEGPRIEVGDEAPDFVASDLDGHARSFKSLTVDRKTLLIFYRGGWCPYCNEQIAALAQDYSKFKALDTAVIAVSGEEVQKGKELLKRIKPPFVLLSDTDFEGIDRYDVRVSPSDEEKAIGVTQLARPSAFIIDRSGIVRYKYVGRDPTDRPMNEDLLAVLKEID